MVDESDLRRLFDNSEAPNRLDVDRIIARSRTRRLPRVVGAAAIGTLAIAGIGVLGVQTLGQQGVTSSMMDRSAEDSGGAAPESMETLQGAPADRLNGCEAPVTEVVPSDVGLQMAVDFPASASADGPVTGRVTLTNTGSQRVLGTTSAQPSITLSASGIVVWHSNGPPDSSAQNVDLEPGESLEYPASFEPVMCTAADEDRETFRADLPAVGPGEYEVSAAIDFTPDPSMSQPSGLQLVMSPREAIALE